MSSQDGNESKPGVLESKKFADGLFRSLVIVCLALVALDIVYQPEHSHWHFSWEGYDGFHAGFGFVAYVAIVMSAKGLRRLVKRGEDYYGD